MNGTINYQVESTLAKYLEFRVFELFRNKFINEIRPHCRENSKEDVYKHIFLCPANLSKKRNFQLTGVLSPFVCLWRTSPINWNKQFYGRSVLARQFIYTDKEGKTAYESGFLYDVEFDFDLFSSSYYRSFRDRVNMDLLDIDRLRYFDIDVKELLKNCSEMYTKIEVMPNGLTQDDRVGNNNENRSFDLTASYKIKATVPYCHSKDYIENIQLYLNDNLIYEHKIGEESTSSSE